MPVYPAGGRPTLEFANEVFTSAEREGGVQLSVRERKRIERAISRYALNRYFELAHYADTERRELRHFARRLQQAIDLMATSSVVRWAVSEFLWDKLPSDGERAAVGDSEILGGRELAHLREMHDSVVEFSEATAREPRRPADELLSGLLLDLEEIYLRVGGRRSGVSKIAETDERYSPFVEFVMPLLAVLPDYMRPTSPQAIASRWERLYQERNRPDDASAEGGSN